jgi:hypothetical protein
VTDAAYWTRTLAWFLVPASCSEGAARGTPAGRLQGHGDVGTGPDEDVLLPGIGTDRPLTPRYRRPAVGRDERQL